MTDRSDLEELEEELARLESELSSLDPEEEEEGKRDPSQGKKGRLGGFLGKLPFGGSKEEPDPKEAPPEAEPAPSGGPEPAPSQEEAPPEPEPAPEPEPTPAAWNQEAGRWRRAGTRKDRDVVVRRLDDEGNVVEEHPTDDPEVLALAGGPGEEQDETGSSGGVFAGFLGRFGGGGGGNPDDEEDDGSRRTLVIVGVVLVALAVVAAAAALYMQGGGGVGGADAPNPEFTVAGGTLVPAGEPVSFDASGTTVPGGASATYTWSFDDGSQAQGVSVTHTFATAGTYNVTLKVEANGASATTSKTITVVTPPEPSVTALVNGTEASAPQTPILAGNEVTLQASTASGADVSGFQWQVGDQTATGPETTFTFPEPGPVEGRLVVAYGGGLQAEQAFTLGVSAQHRFNGTVPASTTAPTQGPMHNFTSMPGGLAATALKVNLTYDTGPGGLLGGAGAQPVVNITDAAGNVVANLTGENGYAEATFTDLSGAAMGTWTAVVEQAQGGAEKTYELRVTVVVPPRPS